MARIWTVLECDCGNRFLLTKRPAPRGKEAARMRVTQAKLCNAEIYGVHEGVKPPEEFLCPYCEHVQKIKLSKDSQ